MHKNEILILEYLSNKEFEMFPTISGHYKYDMDNDEFSGAFNNLFKYGNIEWIEHNGIQKIYVKISEKGRSQLLNISILRQQEQIKNKIHTQKSELEIQNLSLQNENLQYTSTLRNKETEIRELTINNLKLQNRELRQKIVFAILGFSIAYLINNIDKVLKFFNIDIPIWLQ